MMDVISKYSKQSLAHDLLANLLAKMLVLDPDHRISASDALNHPFFELRVSNSDTREVEVEHPSSITKRRKTEQVQVASPPKSVVVNS